MIIPVQRASGTWPDTIPWACTIIDFPLTGLLILTFQLAFKVDPAFMFPKEIFLDPESRLMPSGKVIIAVASLAGYMDALNGEGQGYVISAVTVPVDPGFSDPVVLTLTSQGIITIPQ